MSGNAHAPIKLSSVVNAGRYVPQTSSSSLIVAVRVRPLLKTEANRATPRDIIRLMDSKVVVVLDPDESKDYLDQVQGRSKEKRYTFDIAFDSYSTNEDVYNGTVRDLVSGVLYGINTTVFAYGATGSGKTYTMVGTPSDPGLMVLSLKRIFQDRERLFKDEEFEVICSYLEVYNEVIYDLLVKNSAPLELREDPDQGVTVAGLKQINVGTAEDILGLLEEGNRRRKTEATDANASSSRSHAVLEIVIKRSPRNHYRVQQLRAKLSLVDLAGSERAAETNNGGQKLRDGANINRSLLALANCINALGKMSAPGAKGGAAYVPYRNSKLTRLLKDGLSGNSRTAMIATIAAASDQYHHSVSTLKYADRAKEIKTHVVQNVGTVESHISDYQQIIDNLQVEVQGLRQELLERKAAPPPSATPSGASPSPEDELMLTIDSMVQDMHENVEERINLQKALFEIEDANLFNRYEVRQLEDFLEAGQGTVKDTSEARDRKSDILAAIKDNDKELVRFKAEIVANEEERSKEQARIDRLINTNQNVAFLNLMSTFRLQATGVHQLKFQMAVRDQIISEQRSVIANLWKILDRSGLGRQRVLEIAKQEGIIMDGLVMPLDDPRPSTSQEGSQDATAGLMAQDSNSAMPNVSLAGNRAKIRYKFWQQYNESPLEDDDPPIVSPTPSKGGRRGRIPGGPDRLKPFLAPKHKGAGIRVEHVAHLHPPKGGGQRRQTSTSIGSDGPGAAGLASISKAVSSALSGGAGNNATAPTVRSGRRAGQASGQRRNSDENISPERAAKFALQLPNGRLGGQDRHITPRKKRGSEVGTKLSGPPHRQVERSYSIASAPSAVPQVPQVGRAWPEPSARPLVPPAQAPLGERLARLKGRGGLGGGSKKPLVDLSYPTPEPNYSSQGPGQFTPVDFASISEHAIQATLAMAGVGLLGSRPSSRTRATSTGEGDALDQHVFAQTRLSSMDGARTTSVSSQGGPY